MDIGKIISLLCQGPHRRIHLSRIVGVQPAVGPLHQSHAHARSHSDTLEQIHRRHHHALLSGLLLKGGKLRSCARSPEPAAVCRIQAPFLSLLIDGMVHQNIIALPHHIPQGLILRQVLSDLLAQHIMGLGQLHHPAAIPDQAVPIAGSHIELIGLVCQPALHLSQKHGAVLGADLRGTVVNDGFLFKGNLILRDCHDIAPNGNVRILHGHADAQRLQRRAPRIEFFRVIAQNRQIRRVGARLHPLRNGMRRPDLAEFADPIHIGRPCILQRCLAP